MSEDIEARPSTPDESTGPSSPELSPTLDEDSPAPRGWPAAAIWTTVILAVLCLSAIAVLVLGLVGSTPSEDSQGGVTGIFRRAYGEPSSSREARGQLTELARKDLTTALQHAEEGDFSLAREATERAKALLGVVKTLKPKDTPPEVAQVDEVLGNLEKRDFEGYAAAKKQLGQLLGENEPDKEDVPSTAESAASAAPAQPAAAESSKAAPVATE